MAEVNDTELLKLQDVCVRFPVGQTFFGRPQHVVRAVDHVSLSVKRGSILGVVGESGSGKSTLARAMIGLRKTTEGTVEFDGSELASLKRRELRRLRKSMQIVFQDPYASLNPRRTVRQTLAEPIVEHRLRTSPVQVDERVEELLDMVGLRSNMADRYPHEFSGGQRQRVAIARALAVEPELIVCDEPISALDVSIQAQILNLLLEVRDELDLTYVFVAHDLAVVRRVCTDVAVMYLGRIVEQGTREQIYGAPRHPYTVALLAAVPSMRADADAAATTLRLSGELPSPTTPIAGCAFASRCWLYKQLGEPESCRTERPELSGGDTESAVACHFSDKVADWRDNS